MVLIRIRATSGWLNGAPYNAMAMDHPKGKRVLKGLAGTTVELHNAKLIRLEYVTFEQITWFEAQKIYAVPPLISPSNSVSQSRQPTVLESSSTE